MADELHVDEQRKMKVFTISPSKLEDDDEKLLLV